MKRLLLYAALFIVIGSCQNNASENDIVKSLSDTTSITGLSGDSVKLVKTAGIECKVKDVEKADWGVSSLATQLGGMVFHQQLQSIEGERKELKLSADSLLIITAYTPRATITVRIPSENLELFLHNIADLGYYTSSSQLDIEDKSLAFLENQRKQKNRQDELSKPVNTIKGLASLQSINVKDAMIEQDIANRAIDADVNYFLVNISLFQNSLVRKEVIANYILTGYELPFNKRLQNAIGGGWEMFLSFILFLAHGWMFLLVAGLSWLGYRYVQQARKLEFRNTAVK
ncbi:MAG TPA: DUF4349 domain-containing protein [Flavisolibacter sp.]|nr:DUF4349 domain-containing protein [Flavisolibacter sp.]